jgi:two-component system chemotaxis response regulator CheB
MDGLTALRHLMARYPRPVVMVSSVTHAGAAATMRALAIGAVDFVGKPSGSSSLDFHRVRDELIDKIRAAAAARIHPVSRPAPVREPSKTPLPVGPSASRVVVIGASTGGPRALSTIVPGLQPDGRTAYLLVQHMPAGFTRSLAERLDSLGPLLVKEAAPGDRLQGGVGLVAPGDAHLRLSSGGAIELDRESPRVHGVRPAIDVTLASVARAFGSRATVASLTGMGQDGADGASAIRQAGGTVLAEAESTCVVYGMPRAVVERGLADGIVPLDGMAAAIAQALAARKLVRA